VARAGIVASLLSSMGHARSPHLPSTYVDYAVACGSWFGATKVRYFSLEELLRMVSENQLVLRGQLRMSGNWSGNKEARIGLGQVNIGTDMPIGWKDECADHQQLCHGLNRWATKYGQLLLPDRRAWNQEARRWRRDRGMPVR